MLSNETVNAFCDLVLDGKYIEAIEKFYAPSVEIQENLDPPRIGRDAQLARERQALGNFQIKAERLDPILIAGDNVAIHWRFEMKAGNGKTFLLDEVAWQVWKDDQIVFEQFFYDPRPLAFLAEARA
jgi:hypothetical protein